PCKQALVAFVDNVPVSAVSMRGIKRMVPEHVLRLLRHIPPRHLIDIFVMSKREVHAIETAVRFVDAILGLVIRNRAIGVGGEEFRKNDLIRVSAADGEGIADYGPLGLAIEAEHFSKIVDRKSVV